jgi:DNA primase
MKDAAGKVRGIRLRLPSGKKFSVTGGKEGLFLPDNLSEMLSGGEPLLITEGPTDCAALLDFRFAAIGRPSCTGGVALIVDLVRQRASKETIIVADGDAPGQRGAETLASILVAYARSVRVVTPAAGTKDVRDWKERGATRADVQALIDADGGRRLTVRVKKTGVKNGK